MHYARDRRHLSSSDMARVEHNVPEVASEVQVENTPVSFFVGEAFSTFELEAKIKSYEERNYVKFWKCDCRTIKAARKRVNQSLSENIQLRDHLLLRSWWEEV